MERLQSEMKTQEQQMEDIDGAKKKITVSAPSLPPTHTLFYIDQLSVHSVCVCLCDGGERESVCMF